jgi:hypothetical protein
MRPPIKEIFLPRDKMSVMKSPEGEGRGEGLLFYALTLQR